MDKVSSTRGLRLSHASALHWTLSLILLLMLFLSGSTVQAQAGDVGYRAFTYPGGTGGNSHPTGEKPESKLWWNDGAWYGVLWNRDSEAYHIYRLDTASQVWIDSGVAIDDRQDSRADVLWDGTKLYVVSHLYDDSGGSPAASGSRGELFRYSYDPNGKSYALDSGFPVEVNGGESETLVIDKDSSGTLWVTYVENKTVMLNHSLNGNDLSWGTPFALPAGGLEKVSSDDISSLISYNQHIGVMWSNQNSPKTMYFAVHPVGAPASTWTRAKAYSISGDDHINLKTLQADTSGNVFAVVKTSRNDALIMVLVCKSNGNRCKNDTDWTPYKVYDSALYNPTRPVLMIDESNRHLYVFTRNEDSDGSGKGGIYYKRADLDSVSFPPGMGTPFIRTELDYRTNNPTSTKQNVTAASGLVVLASDVGSKYYMHNYLNLGGAAPLNPVINSFSPASGPAGTEVTINGSNFSGLQAVRFNGQPAASFTGVSGTQVRAVVPSGAISGPISVTTSAGTGASVDSFQMTSPPPAAPSITSFSPSSGPAGTRVTVTGSTLSGVSGVAFNGTAVLSFTIDSATQLIAVVPPGATSGPITVTSPGGPASSADSFTVTKGNIELQKFYLSIIIGGGGTNPQP